MSIWNKVLVGLIALAAIPFFYMAMRALKAETDWSKAAHNLEIAIRQVNTQNQALLDGTDTEPGIRQLNVDVYKLLVDRRRVWAGCDPTSRKPNQNAGMAEITVTINQTDAKGQPNHGIVKSNDSGMVLYAFEELDVKNKGDVLGDFTHGQYLGEFAVTAVNGKQVTFKPTYSMRPNELDRLVKAKRPWVLYELLPRDSHEIFASLSDEQKKAMLPPESVKDYLKDGKPAEKDDPPENVVGGKYVRPLLDYGILFNDEHEKRMLLTDTVAALQQDKQLVLDALEEARTEADACAKLIAATKAETQKMEGDRDIVATHLKKLEKNLGNMQALIARYSEANQAMAGRIAKLQLEAARRIDQRTRVMAQSGAGRL